MKTVKSIIALVLIVVAMSAFEAHAQFADAKITRTKVLDISADQLWGVMRKMDEIDKYSSGIARLEWTGEKGAGGSRVCYAPDGKGYFKENILTYDDTQRTYSYAVVEGVPFTGMVNSWTVVDLGYNKSMVVWTSKYDQFMENPEMTLEQFTGFIDMSIDEYIGNIVSEVTM